MDDPVSFARRLRREQTAAERRFWALLHPFRAGGWHWRRQAPIGPYVVDFVRKRASLVVEIDGDSHYSAEGIAHDRRRTAHLARLGYRVLRFTNLDVLDNQDAVSNMLRGILAGRRPEPLFSSSSREAGWELLSCVRDLHLTSPWEGEERIECAGRSSGAPRLSRPALHQSRCAE